MFRVTNRLLLVVGIAAAIGISGFDVRAEDSGSRVSEEEVRSKTMEFESGLVEGMGKAEGSFAAMTTKARRKKDDHLYNRWINWDRVMHRTVQESRYVQ